MSQSIVRGNRFLCAAAFNSLGEEELLTALARRPRDH
jgi:hypothetical protein